MVRADIKDRDIKDRDRKGSMVPQGSTVPTIGWDRRVTMNGRCRGNPKVLSMIGKVRPTSDQTNPGIRTVRAAVAISPREIAREKNNAGQVRIGQMTGRMINRASDRRRQHNSRQWGE